MTPVGTRLQTPTQERTHVAAHVMDCITAIGPRTQHVTVYEFWLAHAGITDTPWSVPGVRKCVS